MIDRLCLIGVGLIGGSLSLALRRAGYVKSVIGVGRNASNLQEALSRNIIDEASHDAASAVVDADMVVLAVPVGSTGNVFAQIKDHLKKGATVTDAGSVKGDVVTQIKEVMNGTLPGYFVPGHPIAGNENSGARAAFPELYQGRRVLLTPTEATLHTALVAVKRMWEITGAVVEEMPVGHHDRVLAMTSHLPHILAFSLVDSLARQETSEEIFRYAAGGFRDFTRIASSDPVMWRDICLHNREALLAALTTYQQDLSELKKAIEKEDVDTLQAIFTQAKKARDAFLG